MDILRDDAYPETTDPNDALYSRKEVTRVYLGYETACSNDCKVWLITDFLSLYPLSFHFLKELSGYTYVIRLKETETNTRDAIFQSIFHMQILRISSILYIIFSN